jgi:hypothetical protein
MRLFTGTSLFIQVFGKVFFQDFKLSPKYGFAPMGSFVVLALTSMRLIQAKPGDCCIHQAWQEQLWRSLARILMLLRLNRAEGGGS